jgi:menaquinone-dependent protoporphyrinogen oxidase
MNKLLIVYSTWAGATHAVAKKISELLQERSFVVDIQKANSSITIEEYDGYIIGTSIHAGKTIKSFREFIKINLKQISAKPTAVFAVCANMINETENNRQETSEWIKKSLAKYSTFKPLSIGLFGGAFLTEGTDFNNLNFFIRKMILSMNKNLDENQKNPDFYKNDSISDWVIEISEKF